MVKMGLSPDAISVASSFFALLTLVFQYLYGHENIKSAIWGIIATIQLRLLANMMDGMVALEANKKSKLGEVYNDLPDRISDVLVLIGFSFLLQKFAWGTELCFGAAILAVMTAYIRVLGNTLAVKDLFLGPMAKQHRMAFITGCCLVSLFWSDIFYPMIIVLNVGMVVTCYRRTRKIAQVVGAKG